MARGPVVTPREGTDVLAAAGESLRAHVRCMRREAERMLAHAARVESAWSRWDVAALADLGALDACALARMADALEVSP